MVNLSNIKIGMSREEVVATVGDTDVKGGITRKYKTPSVFRYGVIEFYFEPWESGKLLWVQEVRPGVGFLRRLI